MNFMKEIKQRKERRFLKTLGRVGEILVEQVLLKLGSSIIKKIGGKKTLPSILFLFLSLSLFAQYPATGNKQRLGFQTTGDGLVYRGRATDTVAIKSSGLNNAYFILDTVNNIQYNYIKTKGGWVFSNGDTIIINNNFTQPVDSLFFNVGVPTNNVDTAKMRWDSDLATVVLGLNDNVPNELGFKNFWLVKNQTGATITKGSLVYANGTVGASGRITVAKFIANGSIDAKYLLGITAHDLSNGEDGYVISFGKIRQVNTDTFAAGAILYPSPTVAGVWTDIEPIAPNIDMPIGFCINSSVNNGTIAIRVASGYKLSELHDLSITSPVENSSLYYKSGLWRDTTPTLLVSDTASMLTNYFRDADTSLLNLTSRFAAKLNYTDTSFLFTQSDTNQLNLTSRFALKANLASPTFTGTVSGITKSMVGLGNVDNTSDANKPISTATQTALNLKVNISDTASMLTNYLRSGVAASTYLPLTGGTLTGGLTGTSINLSSTINSIGDIFFGSSSQYSGLRTRYFKTTDVSPNRDLFIGSVGTIGTWAGRMHFQTSYNTETPTIAMTINEFGNINMNGTLGVTGATTLTGALTVNNATVLNEGSGDFDTRIESDGNANMVFVDASTDRVGIGTNAPTRTLEVNGTVGVSSNVTANSFIKSGGSFTEFLKADGTVDGNDYLTTSSAGSTYYPKTGGTISGAVTLSTTTATPTSLLGKDGSNVVGEVTTVAQTGLMTRGETTATTGTPSAIFTVTHGLGSNPSSVIITSAGIGGGNKILFEVYTKNSTTFSVQAWNLDGTEASSKSVKIFWLAIK
jgi:hypothetical protein